MDPVQPSKRAAVVYNRLRRRTRKCLSEIDKRDQDAFDRWLRSLRSCKSSQQVDLPSSQIPPKISFITENYAQLFVIIDTCSIVSHRCEFIDYVIRLKQLFPGQSSPIKFIISLVVLEELDKCNRPVKRKFKQERSEQTSSDRYNSRLSDELNSDLIAIAEPSTPAAHFTGPAEPPRMFMRFIEEEMRTSEILLSELDPFKRTPLDENKFEIINKDDRILECTLRSRSFMMSQAHHPNSKVILVTEDNVFKSKATTFEVVSYRWAEFKAKYKNFGLENYITTPLFPSTSQQRARGSLIDRCPVYRASSSGSSIKRRKLADGADLNRSSKVPEDSSKSSLVVDLEKKGFTVTQINRLLSLKDSSVIESEDARDDSVVFVEEVINIS